MTLSCTYEISVIKSNRKRRRLWYSIAPYRITEYIYILSSFSSDHSASTAVKEVARKLLEILRWIKSLTFVPSIILYLRSETTRINVSGHKQTSTIFSNLSYIYRWFRWHSLSSRLPTIYNHHKRSLSTVPLECKEWRWCLTVIPRNPFRTS